MAGVELVHVPYRESVFPDLLGGQVQVAFEPVPAVIGFLKAGKLRGLAVSTRRRIAVLPALPAIDEFLPGYEATGWIGIGAPKNTPAAVVDTLNKVVNAGLADPQLKARLAELGVVTEAMTPAAFKNFIAAETEKWGKVVKLAKIAVQ
jgi:tripartite-type tricarboxylate transporter receptor subunit TctC